MYRDSFLARETSLMNQLTTKTKRSKSSFFGIQFITNELVELVSFTWEWSIARILILAVPLSEISHQEISRFMRSINRPSPCSITPGSVMMKRLVTYILLQTTLSFPCLRCWPSSWGVSYSCVSSSSVE